MGLGLETLVRVSMLTLPFPLHPTESAVLLKNFF